MMDSEILSKAIMFKKAVREILSLTYTLEAEVVNVDYEIDFRTSNGVNIEITYNTKNNILLFIHRVRNIYSHEYKRVGEVIFVTNTFGDTDYYKNEQDIINEMPQGFHILTLENLLFLCGNNEQLKLKLLSCLDFSTESAVPMPLDEPTSSILMGAKKHKFESAQHIRNQFVDELNAIAAGKRASTKYEDFCTRFISTIFQNNIDVPKSQVKNNKGMHRFDIIASLKDGSESFWKFIYEKYNSCFILFECKNYREQIGQEQIYLTEKYLFDKALRNVAIIFTRVGADKNAHLAVQDILKEHGKLILILEDKDVQNLEEYFYNENLSPSEYLMKKTKTLLMNIDK